MPPLTSTTGIQVLFFHTPSKTLIASDGFYGGHRCNDERPTWFARIWFKATKGSFLTEKLPIYRTARVQTHGDVAALHASVDGIVHDWAFEQIVFAHGHSPYREGDVRRAFADAWHAVKQVMTDEQI